MTAPTLTSSQLCTYLALIRDSLHGRIEDRRVIDQAIAALTREPRPCPCGQPETEYGSGECAACHEARVEAGRAAVHAALTREQAGERDHRCTATDDVRGLSAELTIAHEIIDELEAQLSLYLPIGDVRSQLASSGIDTEPIKQRVRELLKAHRKPQSEQAGDRVEEALRRFTASTAPDADDCGPVLREGDCPNLCDHALRLMRADKDAAYQERNRLVAVLARMFPSGIARTDIPGWDPEWHGCVFIDLPTGQASWHYHDSEAAQFAALPPYAKPWDGHSTEEKYGRLAALLSQPAPTPAPCGCRDLLAQARDGARYGFTSGQLADFLHRIDAALAGPCGEWALVAAEQAARTGHPPVWYPILDAPVDSEASRDQFIRPGDRRYWYRRKAKEAK